MNTEHTRRPRAAWAIMALLALPFLVGAGFSAVHQMAAAPDAAAATAAQVVGEGPSPSAS